MTALPIVCINFWCDHELLAPSVKNWQNMGIHVLIIYSDHSNYGQYTNNSKYLTAPEFKDCILVQHEPRTGWQPMDNERHKRQAGLEKARQLGFSHIITADVDEFYEPFTVDWNLDGTVVRCKTYFKNPCLTIGLDVTLVPFVHKITPELRYSFNTRYPFAFDGSGIRIDPTRQFNINSGVELNENIVMHHYSWCRRDIETKIKNSTARGNIERSSILHDWQIAKPGSFCRYYNSILKEAPDLFGLKSLF